MISDKINSYLDAELRMKLESLVITSLPQNSKQSDFNMLYLANIDMFLDNVGERKQISIETDDTLWISMTNDFGHLDFDIIKTLHVPGVISSDFEVISYYPTPTNMPLFANYYEGREVPPGGGYLQMAFCPFGVNKVEMLNGDVIRVYGNGRIPISAEQGGLKGYKEIPAVTKILSNDYFKILKIAIYTRYREHQHRKFTMNVFSPSMRVIEEPIVGQLPLEFDKLLAYCDGVSSANDGGDVFLVDRKNQREFPMDTTLGEKSNLFGIGKMRSFAPDGFLDMSELGPMLGDEFSIHLNVSVRNLARRGTIIFEMGYGVTPVGFQTHHITIWLDKDGELRFNGQYNDEHLGTGFFITQDVEHSIMVTLENQKFDEADDNDYMFFIHVDGKQVWPDKSMLTPVEKIYLWRAKEAYRVFTEVCAVLPAPHPISGGLDSQGTCAKKLLQESGFISIDNLKDVYQMYLRRPTSSKADPKDIILNSTENTTIKKFFIGQDSQKDTFDPEYYFDGEISEIAIFNKPLDREEIELAHLLNIIRTTCVKV